MTTSSFERNVTARGAGDLARFALWPLPQLPPASMQAARYAEPEPAGPPPEELAYARGREDGRREAQAEAQRTLDQAVQRLASVADEFEAARAGFLSELEDNLHVLALAVGRQLLQREVEADPAVVRELVKKALAGLPVGAQAVIHLQPDDYAALEQHLGLPANDPRLGELHWISDPSVEQGGCLIEAPNWVQDALVETGLRELYRKLKDA